MNSSNVVRDANLSDFSNKPVRLGQVTNTFQNGYSLLIRCGLTSISKLMNRLTDEKKKKKKLMKFVNR